MCCFFFFNDTATTEIYTLSLHDALPILTAMVTTEAYEVLGGRPENIEDYEEGCVIEGAAPAEFPLQSSAPSIVSYVSA